MKRIKEYLSNRVLHPVGALWVMAVGTALAGFIITPVVCVLLVIGWLVYNGAFKMV